MHWFWRVAIAMLGAVVLLVTFEHPPGVLLPTLYAAVLLSVVVIVWSDPRIASIVRSERPLGDLRNYQVRYYLAGLAAPPFQLLNTRFAFVAKAPPKLGVWTHFEVPLRADFERLWGVVPQDYDRLRILFEARWDNMPEGSGVRADVYYDDLYLDYGEGPGPG